MQTKYENNWDHCAQFRWRAQYCYKYAAGLATDGTVFTNAHNGIRGTFELYPTGHDKMGFDDATKPHKNVSVNVEYNNWRLDSKTDSL